jgi:hypothetical protein
MLVKNMMEDLGEAAVGTPVPIPNVSLLSSDQIASDIYLHHTNQSCALKGERSRTPQGHRVV